MEGLHVERLAIPRRTMGPLRERGLHRTGVAQNVQKRLQKKPKPMVSIYDLFTLDLVRNGNKKIFIEGEEIVLVKEYLICSPGHG